jgi:hypothetical protein
MKTIYLSGSRLRKRTSWTEIDFLDDADETIVHLPSGRVFWTDPFGDARELGTLTAVQLEALIATEQAALDVERTAVER